MTRKEVQEELLQLVKLLHQEKEEDLRQYKEKIQSASPVERRKNGVCWYPVRLDKTSFNSAERLIVKVSRDIQHRDAHMFQSGKLVSLFSNAFQNNEEEDTVTGVVNVVRDHEMIITLNADDHPEWIDDGKLGVQLLFDDNSYFEMQKGLKTLINNADDRTDRLKQIILGDVDATFEDIEKISLKELNDSQLEALNKVLGANDVAIIHGPPGTGKTTTLVHCILETLKKENQVLVCAPSNTAVDLIVEKLGQCGIEAVRIGHPARVTDEIVNTTLDARITRHNRYKELKTLRKNADEYHRMAHKYKRNYGHTEREQRKLLFAEARRFTAEADLLSNYMKEDILFKSRVIATTLVGANNFALKGKRFSTVFIDEAAQGLEPATWLPILKSERVIFAGDHCQLPPTIKSYEAAKEGLEETLFEKAIKRNKADIMLNEQYRMNSQIMWFSSKQFYNNQLKANDNVKDHTIVPGDLPLEFVDTAGTGFFEEINPETKSSMNPEEMNLLFKHLKNYLDGVEGLGMLDNIHDIGILSPYKAQVSLMQETFENEKPLHEALYKKIAINTIDAFQGQERDIIYISLVRSNENGEIGFLKDYRRMNVAMTRARKKLVIIGDSATIGSDPFYSNFLDYVNEIGAYKSSFELMY